LALASAKAHNPLESCRVQKIKNSARNSCRWNPTLLNVQNPSAKSLAVNCGAGVFAALLRLLK